MRSTSSLLRRSNFDAGRDSSGVIRNISRQNIPPEILAKGNFCNVEWTDVCRYLEPKSAEDKTKVSYSCYRSIFSITLYLNR